MNLLGKISATGRTHLGCSESQEYIYFSVEKTEKNLSHTGIEILNQFSN